MFKNMFLLNILTKKMYAYSYYTCLCIIHNIGIIYKIETLKLQTVNIRIIIIFSIHNFKFIIFNIVDSTYILNL